MGLRIDWEVLHAMLDGKPLRTRFAPSPTGYLHMGHVVHALYVWGIAEAMNGQVVLRIENHDRTRCKPEYEVALLENLQWLGLNPDEGKPEEFRAGHTEYRQSDCGIHYQEALKTLQSQGKVYVCACSRKRIQARTNQTDLEELRYDGHCRDLNLKDAPGMTLRLRLPNRTVEFYDISLGPQSQHPLQDIGDFALRDNHGHWTYQFAVVVDDLRQGINVIIRGMDILSSTGRQLLLAEMLGQKIQPLYLHHPLLVDSAGRKLSKRDFSSDIHTLMLAGEDSVKVLLEIAALTGIDLDVAALRSGKVRLNLNNSKT